MLFVSLCDVCLSVYLSVCVFGHVRARVHKQNQTHKANLVSDVETQGFLCLALLEALDERFLVELSADEDEAALACLPLL